jgi:hypothetical protein
LKLKLFATALRLDSLSHFSKPKIIPGSKISDPTFPGSKKSKISPASEIFITSPVLLITPIIKEN